MHFDANLIKIGWQIRKLSRFEDFKIALSVPPFGISNKALWHHKSLTFTFTALWANSADDKLLIFFLFFIENRFWHFMKTVSRGEETVCMKCQSPFYGEKKIRKIFNKSCHRTVSSPAGYILYCNIFIIKPYNIGHTDLDVFVCKSFCHIDIIIQVWQFSMK